MTSPRFHFAIFVWLLPGCLWLASSPAVGQQQDIKALEKTYLKTVAETREKIKTCREISCRFFDGGLNATHQWKDPWDVAVKELADQAAKLRQATTDWFLVNKEPDRELLILAGQIAVQLQQERKYEMTKRILLRCRRLCRKRLRSNVTLPCSA